MKATIFITQTGDMIKTGAPARATLYEFPVSRTWTRRVQVELPEGYTVACTVDNLPGIFNPENVYMPLAANSAGDPVLLDVNSYGSPHIPLKIMQEGWDWE